MRAAARLLPLVVAALALGACEREPTLSGERLDLRDGRPLAAADLPAGARAFSPPPAVNHSAWTHTNGTPRHAIQHPALSPVPVPVWSTPFGAGDSRGNRITASPVAAGGLIYMLDARAGVAALDARTGAPLWRRDLTPPADAPSDGSGGGLALGGGRLFVTSGFGTLTALDASTGATAWTQRLGGAATGAPTVEGGTVYAVSRDGQGWAVDAGTGRVRWRVDGATDASGVTGPAGPATTDALVLFPFGAGDLGAAAKDECAVRWTALVAGGRLGAAYGGITDITGAVVTDGPRVYAGNASGRIVALDGEDGTRLWTARDGAVGPVWPASGSVFAVTDAGTAVRLDAATGRPIWTVRLPYFADPRPRRRQAIVAHYGPVLAGGRLWIAGSDGALRGLDPATGALVARIPVPAGAASAPVVVDGVLYVAGQDGRLHAYR